MPLAGWRHVEGRSFECRGILQMTQNNLFGERFELVEVGDVQGEDVDVGVLAGKLSQLFGLEEQSKVN